MFVSVCNIEDDSIFKSHKNLTTTLVN
jgi:hypothetical protein